MGVTALSEHVFRYCERATSEALFAEPLNAATNAAFLLAALVALLLLLRRPKDAQSADHFLLIALVFLIGLGSAAFHVFADRLSGLADVVPIGIFMLVYLGFAVNRFLRVPPGWTVLTVIGFTAIVFVTMQLRCWNGGVGFPGADVTNANVCLNGSLGYVPALLALFMVGVLLRERRHPAALYLLWAGAIFAVSIALRSLDFVLCDAVVIAGRKVGTHFAWHLLNALTLFLLLLASLKVRRDDAPEPEPIILTAADPATVEPVVVEAGAATRAEPSRDDPQPSPAAVAAVVAKVEVAEDRARAAKAAKKEAMAKAVSEGEMAFQRRQRELGPLSERLAAASAAPSPEDGVEDEADANLGEETVFPDEDATHIEPLPEEAEAGDEEDQPSKPEPPR